MASTEEQQQKRTPFSARLPQASLDEIIPVVEALAVLGAPSTPAVIAQQMGTNYGTDARFRTRLGAAGYYGFIRKDGAQRVLTPRGEAVTGGDANAARQARREAVMSTTFGPIIHSLRAWPVNENTVALRVRADHDVPEGSSPKVARVLVEAASQAGLIVDNRFDAAAIEALANVMPTPDEEPSPAPSRPKKEPEKKRTPRQEEQVKAQRGTVMKEDPRPPFVPGVQVVVKIDASNLTPQQIAELVRALQTPNEPQSS